MPSSTARPMRIRRRSAFSRTTATRRRRRLCRTWMIHPTARARCRPYVPIHIRRPQRTFTSLRSGAPSCAPSASMPVSGCGSSERTPCGVLNAVRSRTPLHPAEKRSALRPDAPCAFLPFRFARIPLRGPLLLSPDTPMSPSNAPHSSSSNSSSASVSRRASRHPDAGHGRPSLHLRSV